jgi:hypothetical protein
MVPALSGIRETLESLRSQIKPIEPAVQNWTPEGRAASIVILGSLKIGKFVCNGTCYFIRLGRLFAWLCRPDIAGMCVQLGQRVLLTVGPLSGKYRGRLISVITPANQNWEFLDCLNVTWYSESR